MRNTIALDGTWKFIKKDTGAEEAVKANGETVTLPHTWNNLDGQDGGADYYRGACWYVKEFQKPEIPENGAVYLEFKGVNSQAEIYLNGELLCSHDGGYSAFRANATKHLKDNNVLCVRADNSETEKVYPQTADFTFYGGIYRDVNLVVLNSSHFDMDYYGACGVKVMPEVNGNDGEVAVTAYVTGGGEVKIQILDRDKNVVAEGGNGEKLTVINAKLWNGTADPYLYTARAELTDGGEVTDVSEQRFGFRTFSVDPNKGFILNGKQYPLRGLCRHQDRRGLGNAITRAEHDEDMRIIIETGANTLRLAHYQHDDYFYDLCDEYGLVVWAEIPYISRHMPEANGNAEEQMKELIFQQFNHASICFWGISNEITMFRKHKKDMLEEHRKLNALCKELDPSRLTTLACFAMCGPANKVAHITDVVSWNLYLGWYVPGLFLNKVWFGLFRFLFPKRCVGLSEYGAEAMPNLHSARPRRFDNTEEYQLKYHAYMLKFFEKRQYLWATHVWNTFDFAADARNQGGEPGMNHKGLVTFDRKIKKDSFYIYKAYWSEEDFLHICGKRFENRTGSKLEITVCSNLKQFDVYADGKKVKTVKCDKLVKFKIPFNKDTTVKIVSGNSSDEHTFRKVAKPDPSYKLNTKSNNMSWQK